MLDSFSIVDLGPSVSGNANKTYQTFAHVPPPASGIHPDRPEFYRLPKPRSGDPYFGLTRSYYYELEKLGKLTLVRLRRRGTQRGITLVPYLKVAELVRLAQVEAEVIRLADAEEEAGVIQPCKAKRFQYLEDEEGSELY